MVSWGQLSIFRLPLCRWALLLCCAFAVSPFCLAETVVPKPKLQLLTEDYPPLTFSDRGVASGLATEIVREMLTRSGYEATIEVVPWARGYAAAIKTPNVGLFATSRIPERESIFKWIGPLSAARGYLYAKQTLRDPPVSIEDARRFSGIAVPREWYLHQILRQKNFTNLSPVATPAASLRMLAADRVPLAALDEVTYHETAMKEGIAPESIKPVVLLTEVRQYLVFSRDTDDKVVRDLQRAFDSLLADGTLARLYRHWLPGIPLPN